MFISILVLLFSVFTMQSSLNTQSEPEKHRTGKKRRKLLNLRCIFSFFHNYMINLNQICLESSQIIISLPHSIYTLMWKVLEVDWKFQAFLTLITIYYVFFSQLIIPSPCICNKHGLRNTVGKKINALNSCLNWTKHLFIHCNLCTRIIMQIKKIYHCILGKK